MVRKGPQVACRHHNEQGLMVAQHLNSSAYRRCDLGGWGIQLELARDCTIDGHIAIDAFALRGSLAIIDKLEGSSYEGVHRDNIVINPPYYVQNALFNHLQTIYTTQSSRDMHLQLSLLLWVDQRIIDGQTKCIARNNRRMAHQRSDIDHGSVQILNLSSSNQTHVHFHLVLEQLHGPIDTSKTVRTHSVKERTTDSDTLCT